MITQMLVYLLATLIVLHLFRKWWQMRTLPPGPWGWPVVGYLPYIDAKAPYLTFTELAKKYGPIYSVSLGSVCTIVITDPKFLRYLFAKEATAGRAPLYLTHGIMKGYGLICAEGDLWKEQRRFVQNCLRTLGCMKTGPQRKKNEELILGHVNDFVQYVKETIKEEAIDPLDALRHSLGSVVNDLVFGEHYARDDQIWKWLLELQEEGTKHIGVAGPLNFLPFLRFLPSFYKSMSFLIDGQKKTHRFYQKLIERAENELTSNGSGDPDMDYACNNLLQGFLIERRKKRRDAAAVAQHYNDQQFYHLLADVFGAGLDTTLTTLRWFVLFIGLHEEYQIEARNEIRAVLDNGSRTPCADDMRLMPFVEACIAETQRIRSVVPVGIPHGTVAEMREAGFTFPKGAMIVPLQWAIHMDPAQYKDPEVFDPKHFLDAEGKFYKTDRFIPFQSGKRMCVGDELARTLLFLFVVTILRNFSIELVDKEGVTTEGDCGITLAPKPFKIRFKPLL